MIRQTLMATGVLVAAATMTLPARADDFDVIRVRWREKVLQDAPATNVVRGYLDSLGTNGTWADVAYADRTPGGWKPNLHLTRMIAMAKALQTPNQPLFGDAKLKTAALRAWDGWFSVVPKGPKNRFGTPESDNWWHNEFGAVTHFENFAVLMGDDLDKTRFERGVPALGRAWNSDFNKPTARDQGGNLLVRTFLATRLATLTRDGALITEAVARTVGALKFSDKEGLHRDYSFRTHDLFYSMHYGLGYVLHPTDTLILVSGTRFAPPLQSLQILSDYVLEGQAWQFRRGWMDYATTGRAIAETSYQARRQKRSLDAYSNLLETGAPRRPEIEALMRRIQNDTAEGEPTGNRHFWRADFMAHKRPTYHVSVRMASKRLKAAELINQQGILGFYQADGVMSLQRRGPEYSDLMPVWDWTRLPGITARAAELPPDIAPPERRGSGGHIFGVGEFVGGVSDGDVGAATFDYAKHDVRARKSWFFFDREIACLGAGIESKSQENVRTSINQAHLQGEVIVGAADAATTSPRGERVLTALSYVHHDQIGYVFPPNAAVTLKNEAQTGSWRRVHGESPDKPISLDVFSLWLDHGAKPQDATYQYIIVPEVSPSQTAAYAKSPAVRVLSNTPQLQAVTHDDAKITSAIFYEAGTLQIPEGLSVRVDEPCAFLMREQDGVATISLSDPRQRAGKVTVTIGGKPLVFDLPGGEFGGQTVSKVVAR